MFNPNFKISNKILNNLTEIAEIKSIVDRSPVLPKQEAHLRRRALIKMAHFSTSIEGNKLAEFQVQKVFEGEKIPAEQKEVLEVENYQKSITKMEEISQTKNNISLNDILTLHKILTKDLVIPEKNGHLRPNMVYVANIDNGKENVVYTPCKTKEVEFYLNELVDWTTNNTQTTHPIVTAGLLHYQFVTIHPFTDGNGRLTRLLTQLHLYQRKYDFKKILVLDEYYYRNRKEYYQALDTGPTFYSRKHADLTNWLEYFTDGFVEEARTVKENLQAMGFAKELNMNEQIFLDKDQVKMMDFVSTVGKITSSDVVDILQIPKRTAQAKLKELSDMKLLQMNGKGPSTYYILKK
ncbi:hypothetical protein A2X44_02475 [candidate division CPR3 bacterium GWF2_35_18]|uniref:Filamentation induced by cAMP protein Fic n=1 Tax=candidate division CPR3 bacterium GW2011_GWF2_35_18 TaxID=1618350 RepID=A0A0G0C1S7_UNCC3|nr:MAG: Filamentation induced by cAMP protein Fic [candidate division CPR3 bacterium GW2011_GWF2_35_18]KKP86620.1 MAG: Filamentation induced by cAMP protein Fic [candidate division CPR3 bacterium GW2011_GWE2_35_7]OGB62859.1 MAG: hypothetical protein A2X44_02475 [candidate division CPR3 bacterium GWF2_35_18]OGB65440.1 MAG: hypothetical protein A2250_00690 [candidate division CPR3 bacterium RIFOXYA2_FULL_35_13]OGB78953.1 MAG: hypothetical protein A2296_03295 [candidate division CPR3 bacterium RIF